MYALFICIYYYVQCPDDLLQVVKAREHFRDRGETRAPLFLNVVSGCRNTMDCEAALSQRG